MMSFAKPWLANRTIFARITSRYGDVYCRARLISSARSLSESMITERALSRHVASPSAESDCANPARLCLLQYAIVFTNGSTKPGDELAEFVAFITALGLKNFKPYEGLVMGHQHSDPQSPAFGLNHHPPKDLWPNIVPAIRMLDQLRDLLGARSRSSARIGRRPITNGSPVRRKVSMSIFARWISSRNRSPGRRTGRQPFVKCATAACSRAGSAPTQVLSTSTRAGQMRTGRVRLVGKQREFGDRSL